MHVCACVCVHKDVRLCEAACELACSTYISPSYLLWCPATSLSRYFGFRRTPMRLLTSNSMGRSGAINWIWKKKKPNSQNNQNIFVETRKFLQRSTPFVHTYLAVVFFQQHLKQLYITYGTRTADLLQISHNTEVKSSMIFCVTMPAGSVVFAEFTYECNFL